MTRVPAVIRARILQLGCLGLALNITTASADRSLRLSTAHLVAESPTVVVTHDHDIEPVKDSADIGGHGIQLSYRSTLQIVRKSDNAELFKQFVMPLTALTSVNEGQYFAGLSNLRALSHKYNLLLITADGQIVTTALITPTSGHCRAVSWTSTNYIRWFDEETPDVQLSVVGDRVDTVTVSNPYDRGADGSTGKCVIRVATADANSPEKQ